MKRETLDQLTKEFQKFCADNNLPQLSADELLDEGTGDENEAPNISMTDGQKAYIKTFIDRWYAAEKKEHDLEEFKKEQKAIADEAEEKRKQLCIKYAASQRVCEVGDIVTDHIGSIKVEKFGTSITFGIPEPTYIGMELKKDLTPTKKGDKRTVYQNNVESYAKSK